LQIKSMNPVKIQKINEANLTVENYTDIQPPFGHGRLSGF
jgi:hypothetical protein